MDTIGVNLKATSGWNSSGNGTDDFGFSVLPAGYYGSIFSLVGDNAFFWSATEGDATLALSRRLFSNLENLSPYSISKSDGFSSRCIQD